MLWLSISLGSDLSRIFASFATMRFSAYKVMGFLIFCRMSLNSRHISGFSHAGSSRAGGFGLGSGLGSGAVRVIEGSAAGVITVAALGFFAGLARLTAFGVSR